MLTLFQPPPAWGLPNVSPFCLKLETYLRMTGEAYQVEPPKLSLGPKGKVPYISDGDVTMGDSGLIIDYLVRRGPHDLDADLDPSERAHSHVLRRMAEEHLYFLVAFLRWSNPAAWPHLVEAFRPMLPPGLAGLVVRVVRRSIMKKTHAQGIARHDRAEILGMLDRDLEAIDVLLAERPFFCSDRPRTIDATMYGFLAQIQFAPWASEEQELFRRHPRLVAYVDNMKQRYWADWVPA